MDSHHAYHLKINKHMKTLVLMVIICVLAQGKPVLAQGSDFSDAKILAGGLSISYGYDYPLGRSLSIPPMNAYLELGMHEYVTAGPFIAFSRWQYRDRMRSFLTVGGRGSFHLTPFINDWFDATIDESEWDFYGTVASGFNFRRYGAHADQDESGFRSNVRFFIGPAVGARYYVADPMALYAELGAGPLGALTIGVSVDL